MCGQVFGPSPARGEAVLLSVVTTGAVFALYGSPHCRRRGFSRAERRLPTSPCFPVAFPSRSPGPGTKASLGFAVVPHPLWAPRRSGGPEPRPGHASPGRLNVTRQSNDTVFCAVVAGPAAPPPPGTEAIEKRGGRAVSNDWGHSSVPPNHTTRYGKTIVVLPILKPSTGRGTLLCRNREGSATVSSLARPAHPAIKKIVVTGIRGVAGYWEAAFRKAACPGWSSPQGSADPLAPHGETAKAAGVPESPVPVNLDWRGRSEANDSERRQINPELLQPRRGKRPPNMKGYPASGRENNRREFPL